MQRHKDKTHSTIRPIALWLVLWVSTQGLFIVALPSASTTRNVSTLYAAGTLWVGIVATTFRLYRTRRLRVRRLELKRTLLPYLVPLAALTFLPSHYQSALPIELFITMVVVTTFWQDSLTFGYLQGALEAKFTRLQAALVVALVFFAGHAVFIPFAPNALQALLQMPLIVVAATALSASRLATRKMYLSNAIHLAYLITFA